MPVHREPLSIYQIVGSMSGGLVKLTSLGCHFSAILSYYLVDIESKHCCRGVSILMSLAEVLVLEIWNFPGDIPVGSLVTRFETLSCPLGRYREGATEPSNPASQWMKLGRKVSPMRRGRESSLGLLVASPDPGSGRECPRQAWTSAE